MNDFVKIEGLSKSFASGDSCIQVLENLSLTLPRGQMLAVTGESGSGKSTFLHLLGGMEKPDSGSILVDQQELTTLDGPDLARFRNHQIGFIFQFHHLLPEFTAQENVMFPLLLRGVDFPTAAEKALRKLSEMGLEQRSHHRPGELSGGEQQRVAIARALAGKPSLLLGDEPTGNLDSETSSRIHRLLLEVHEKHELTSVIVTHNPVLAEICSSEKRMTGGRLQHVR